MVLLCALFYFLGSFIIIFKIFLHLVCLHMIFLLSLPKLPYNLIKENLTKLIEQTFTERAHFIWLVMRNAHFSLLNNLKDII